MRGETGGGIFSDYRAPDDNIFVRTNASGTTLGIIDLSAVLVLAVSRRRRAHECRRIRRRQAASIGTIPETLGVERTTGIAPVPHKDPPKDSKALASFGRHKQLEGLRVQEVIPSPRTRRGVTARKDLD